MKRTIFLIIIMGFLASLLGCGRQATSPQASAPPRNISAIDYAHESEGIFYHGTITLIDGDVGVTWTLDDGNGKKSHDIAMTGSTFKDIWDSLSTVPDFKTGVVTDPNQKLDPSADYVIGVVSSVGSQQKMQAYMIPAATASPAFHAWLDKSGYTGK
jgi:hypothetical protein